MLELALVAILLVAATVAIHAFGTVYWLRFLVHRYAGHDGNFTGHFALHAVTATAIVSAELNL